MKESLVSLLEHIYHESKQMVWWKTEQIARGEDVTNDPKKGERPWIIPKTTAQFLHDTIREHNFRCALELGTSIGYSTIWIAHALSENNGHIHTIEHSLNKIPVAKNYFKESGLEHTITLHEGMIMDVLYQLPEQLLFDFVFMDADRGHYHEYFPHIKKHLVPGALIIADNAGNMNTRMQPFFDLLTRERVHFEIKDLDNGLLIAKIPSTDPEVNRSN